jgi:HEPN domain-containing protein
MVGARQFIGGKLDVPDLVCFHCQQAVEKYIKALLQELSIAFPRQHDLELLVDLMPPRDLSLKKYRHRLKRLTDFAVEYRYPGKNATKRQAQAAMRLAEMIRQEIRTRLGLGA